MRRTTGAVISLTLLVGAFAGGCAAEDPARAAADAAPSDIAASPSATPDSEPATTPAEPSVEEAAQAYLELVRPYNEALESWENSVNAGEPLDVVTAAAADAAVALEKEARGLRQTAWPADVEPHADDLADASEQAAAVWRDMSAAASYDDVSAAVDALSQIDDGKPASAVRELLELERYEEQDYQDTDG